MEVWADIRGYEGSYQVSNKGRVKSLPRTVRNGKYGVIKRVGQVLKGRKKGDGYIAVRLSGTNKLVHRLVAEAFIPNPENKPYVNHINLNKSDNDVDNLEWCTHRENMIHARDMGVFEEAQVRGEEVKISKLTESAVRDIRLNFSVEGGKGNVYFAKKYGVSTVAVRLVRKKRTWKHVV